MNNDLINELYSKIDNQEKIIVDLQKNNSGITLEEHVRVLNAYQELQEKYKKQKEVIDRKKYLLKEQGTELKELYSEIDKLQGRIDKAIEYLEEPNRDSFDYSKTILLDIIKEVPE